MLKFQLPAPRFVLVDDYEDSPWVYDIHYTEPLYEGYIHLDLYWESWPRIKYKNFRILKGTRDNLDTTITLIYYDMEDGIQSFHITEADGTYMDENNNVFMKKRIRVKRNKSYVAFASTCFNFYDIDRIGIDEDCVFESKYVKLPTTA